MLRLCRIICFLLHVPPRPNASFISCLPMTKYGPISMEFGSPSLGDPHRTYSRLQLNLRGLMVYPSVVGWHRWFPPSSQTIWWLNQRNELFTPVNSMGFATVWNDLLSKLDGSCCFDTEDGESWPLPICPMLLGWEWAPSAGKWMFGATAMADGQND